MNIDVSVVKKILIVNLAFIGDVILTTPIVRGLHQAFPKAQIDMMVIPAAAPIAALHPYVTKVWEYDKRGKHKKILPLQSLIVAVRKEQYDLTVSTNFALRSAMMSWISGAPYRAGYDAQHAKWLLTHVASATRIQCRHEAENQLDVLQALGIAMDDSSLQLEVQTEDTDDVQKIVKRTPGKKIVVICPAGSYQRKSWNTKGYATLLKAISPIADCCLIGGKREKDLLDEINVLSDHVAQVFAGTLTLGQVAALLKVADLLISVDTGPLHIGQAVGTPVLALFGPTDPAIWGPRGSNDSIMYKQVDCSPCWGKGECIGHLCMANILPEEVIGMAMNMLDCRGGVS